MLKHLEISKSKEILYEIQKVQIFFKMLPFAAKIAVRK